MPLNGQDDVVKMKIMKSAVEFLCRENELSSLMKWKYLAGLLEYNSTIVKEIFLSCSSEEVSLNLIPWMCFFLGGRGTGEPSCYAFSL